MREIGPPAVAEVHDRERDLAHHVDPAHLLVELDAVEDRERAVHDRDVAEVEVPVAFADESTVAAPGDLRRSAGVLGDRPTLERIDLRELRVAVQQRPDLG